MVAKYSIVGLTAGQVLVSRNSVKAIKQEFQRLVTENTSDLVVLDYTGETFVRYVGGKILKGTNYRKFTRRGVQEPKPKAPEAPACTVPTIQNVCQDVIDRIDSLKLQAKSGNLFGLTFRILMDQADSGVSAQNFIKNNVCAACGKGAVLSSYVGLYNNFTVGQLRTCQYELDNYRGGGFPEELVGLFGRVLLDEIEVAFECTSYSWTHRDARYRPLIEKYCGIQDKQMRLRQIMCDVRDGKF